MNWLEVQKTMYGDYEQNDPLWCTCYACGKKVHQGVGTLHIGEEHPEIVKSMQIAIKQSIDIKIRQQNQKNGSNL